MRRMFNLTRIWWTSFSVGGTAFALSGCEPAVRDTVLTGVESAAGTILTSFLTAFFQTLQEPAETGVGTVKAILENLPDVFT